MPILMLMLWVLPDLSSFNPRAPLHTSPPRSLQSPSSIRAGAAQGQTDRKDGQMDIAPFPHPGLILGLWKR